MKNTGKSSEKIFESFWVGTDNYVCVYRFEDYADVNFKNSRGVKKIVSQKPSDYLITQNGVTSYAEVKSVSKGERFNFSNIKASQWKAATKVTKAKGLYFFYIHLIESNNWYKVPAEVILRTKKRSLNKKDLAGYLWDLPNKN